MPPTSGNPTAGTSPVSGANNSTKYSYDANTGKFDLTDGFNPPPVNAGSGPMAPNNAAGGSAPGGPMPGGSRGGGVPIPGGGNMIASNNPNFMPGFTDPSSGSAPGGGDALAHLEANIARTESGGNYGAIGPVTKSGDRAYGKYQVMGANIPQWTEQVLGQPMTPAQFRASPQAQEAVAAAKLGAALEKYGPAGAAREWFTGSPVGKGSDVNGMTADRYAALATSGMGGGEGGQPNSSMMVAGPGAPSGNQGGAPAQNQPMGGFNMQAARKLAMNPYADPEDRQAAMQMIQMYGMPHPMTWQTNPGTNDRQGYDWMGRPVQGAFMPGPHPVEAVEGGADMMGQKPALHPRQANGAAYAHRRAAAGAGRRRPAAAGSSQPRWADRTKWCAWTARAAASGRVKWCGSASRRARAISDPAAMGANP